MKLDHETILRNYQKALAYAKEHYSAVSMKDSNGSLRYFCPSYDFLLEGSYAVEYDNESRRHDLYYSIENGNISLARNGSGGHVNPILIPSDIDMLTFLAFLWDDLKAKCEKTLDAYNRAMNFDPGQPVSEKSPRIIVR